MPARHAPPAEDGPAPAGLRPAAGAPAKPFGLRRCEQAGAQPVSWIGVLCELQRDWARGDTTADMVRIGSENGGAWATEIALKEFASKGVKTS